MKLIEALNRIAKAEKQGPTLPLALVTGFTPLHLQTFLHAELLLLFPQRQIEIITGLFGDVAGTLQKLRNELLEAVVITLEWEDLDPRLGIRQLGGWGSGNLADIIEQAKTRLSQLQLLVVELSNEKPVILSPPTLPLPPLFLTGGWQASNYELVLRRLLADFCAECALGKRVRILSAQRLDSLSRPEARLDVRSCWTSGFLYRLEHASQLATLLAKLIQNPIAKKGLITDLDNTLWSGIVGECGAEGLHWTLEQNSQAHGLYQQLVSALAEDGTLVAAVSKNDPSVVAEAFRRDDLLLSAERVFPFEVSWGSKAGAIDRVLTAWNITADAVVFVDDDPMELAEVQTAHPDLTCLQFFPADPQLTYALLEQLRDLFGKTTVSAEDRLRLTSIRSSASIRASGTENVEGFSEALLEKANAELIVTFCQDDADGRALELINKTNQFNLNGRRYTEASWQMHLRESDVFLMTVAYKDRFGSLGKIAVVTGRHQSSKLIVDSWVMSCRAFARRIEHQCLRLLFEKFNSERLFLDYSQTPRNAPITDFLKPLTEQASNAHLELQKERFESTCPQLFHTVRETN